MQTALNEPIYLEKIKPDERKFIDLDGCLSFVSEEHVMYKEIPAP